MWGPEAVLSHSTRAVGSATRRGGWLTCVRSQQVAVSPEASRGDRYCVMDHSPSKQPSPSDAMVGRQELLLSPSWWRPT